MSIILTEDVESQQYIKYIDMQYHYICELVNIGDLTIK